MKGYLKKLLIVISIVIMLFNILSVTLIESNKVYAADGESEESESDAGLYVDGLVDASLELVDGIVGLLLWKDKALVLLIGTALRGAIAGITKLDGGNAVTSIDQILFNEANITRIDFFDLNTGGTAIQAIKNSVAAWYFAMRNIAIVMLLGVLIYVGIRMAIASTASDEAKYKKMLKDWVVSLALVFVLHYIMVFTIEFNNTLVDTIGQARGAVNTAGTGPVVSRILGWFTDAQGDMVEHEFNSAINALGANSFSLSASAGFGSAIGYVMLIGVTLIFLIMYIKRMLTIGFLIIIAPLITVTYSIDKMGDGKSQALNTWLKEFIFNVLIQPFHCIIYLIYVSIAVNLLTKERTLAGAVFAVIMIAFIFSAEKIIKNIFNFKSGSLGDAIASTAVVTAGIKFLRDRSKARDKGKIDRDKMPDMTSEKGMDNNKFLNQNGNGVVNNAQNTNSNVAQDNSQTGQNTTGTNQEGSNQGGGAWMPPPPKSKREKFSDYVKGSGSKLLDKVNPLTFSSSNIKAAQMIAMGALGASTGSAKAIIPAMMGGAVMGDAINNKINNSKANKMVKRNEEAYAAAVTNYHNQNPNLTNEQVEARIGELLKAKPEDVENMSDADKNMYVYANNLQKTYSVVGYDEEDAFKGVINATNMVHNGDIQPDFNNVARFDPSQVLPSQNTNGTQPQAQTQEPVTPEQPPEPVPGTIPDRTPLPEAERKEYIKGEAEKLKNDHSYINEYNNNLYQAFGYNGTEDYLDFLQEKGTSSEEYQSYYLANGARSDYII